MATYEPHDKFYLKARARGLPSRSAFKLEELSDRLGLIRPGARIVDLGCAPGGWLAVLAERCRPGGRVVGVDLKAVERVPSGVETLVGDVREPGMASLARQKLGGEADLVTSDLAPKLSGIAARDEASASKLVETALDFARAILTPGGACVVKLFMAPDFAATVATFKARFRHVEVTRVRATRRGSSELYLVARGFRQPRS